MITHTISLTELIWTLFCSVGFILNGRILLRAVGDWNYLRARRINSLREYSAILTIFTYSTWTLIQFAFVLVGGFAMTQPPAPGSTQAVTTFSIILTGVFISTSILMAGGALVNEVGRRRLVAKMNEFDL